MGFWKPYACVCADKGTVARDYFLFLFFHGSTLFWAHILGAKRFRFLFVRRKVESWLIDCLQLYITGNHALATESVAGATKLLLSAAFGTLRSPTIRRSSLATTATATTLLYNTEYIPRGLSVGFPRDQPAARGWRDPLPRLPGGWAWEWPLTQGVCALLCLSYSSDSSMSQKNIYIVLLSFLNVIYT